MSGDAKNLLAARCKEESRKARQADEKIMVTLFAEYTGGKIVEKQMEEDD